MRFIHWEAAGRCHVGNPKRGPHVAFMLHGAAVLHWQPLKFLGKILRHMRHDRREDIGLSI